QEPSDDEGVPLAVVVPADDQDETPGFLAQNLFSVSAYGDDPSQFESMTLRLSDASVLPMRDVFSRYRIGQFQVVPDGPGTKGITVQGAAFESHRFSGRLYFDFNAICVGLGLQKNHSKSSKWFNKRRQRWEVLSVKYGGSGMCLRKSVPYGAQPDDLAQPERCLMFPSVSARFTLLLALRSSAAVHARHGLLHGGSRDAFERLFNGLLGKIPENFDIHLRADHAASKVADFHFGRCPFTVTVRDGIVRVQSLRRLFDEGKVPYVKCVSGQIDRFLHLDGEGLYTFVVQLYNAA
ncbi:unnamed protein product, partial [Prorocentrum cordatum]